MPAIPEATTCRCQPPTKWLACRRLPGLLLGAWLVAASCTLPAATLPEDQLVMPVPPAPCPEGACLTTASHTPDIWAVSTRGLPDIGCMPTAPHVGVEKLGNNRRWQRSDLASLMEDSTRPLLLFVHGDRYDHGSALQQGLFLASRAAACCPTAPPFRTVVISWPSSKDGILLCDTRKKYERSMSEGHYLAWLLGQVNPERPVALIGYSYGALITLEALNHLVEAHRTGRHDVQPWPGRTGRVQVIFIAAAVRQDAFAPRGAYRHALTCIDRLTLLNNSRDKALRFFEHVDRTMTADALGHEGMPSRWIPAGTEFLQLDATNVVGKNHRLLPYLESPALARRICTGAMEGLSTP